VNYRRRDYYTICAVCHRNVHLIVDPGTSLEAALVKLSKTEGWTVILGEVVCPDPHGATR
jgi:hypothetical protein